MPKGHTPPEPGHPPFYEATGNLYVYNPDAGVMPVLAYVPGARVDPDVVAANGWQHLVKVPDMFAGQYAPPPAPPGHAAGQTPAGEE